MPGSFKQEIVTALHSVVTDKDVEEAAAFIHSTLPSDRSRRGQ
jgi:hypothetical protein